MEPLIWVGNLGEAAALVVLGNPTTTKRVNPFNKLRRQTQFGFEKTATIAVQIANYWDGKLLLDPMQFYNAINDLRKQRREFEGEQEFDSNLNNLKY